MCVSSHAFGDETDENGQSGYFCCYFWFEKMLIVLITMRPFNLVHWWHNVTFMRFLDKNDIGNLHVAIGHDKYEACHRVVLFHFTTMHAIYINWKSRCKHKHLATLYRYREAKC